MVSSESYLIHATIWRKGSKSSYIVWRVEGLPVVGDGVGVGDQVHFYTKEITGARELKGGTIASIVGHDDDKVFFRVKANSVVNFCLAVPRVWTRQEWWVLRLWSWFRRVLGGAQITVVDEEAVTVPDDIVEDNVEGAEEVKEEVKEGQVDTAASAKVAVDN